MVPSAASRPRVLVVDDDDDIRMVIGWLLDSEGYQVCEAHNGLEALGALRGPQRPDVVLLDLMMPVMTGWQFRAEQRNDPAVADIPVIVMSAVARSPGSLVEQLGAAWVLTKPVMAEDLLATIAATCGSAVPTA